MPPVRGCNLFGFFDVGDSVSYGLDLLGLFVGNFDAEFFLKLHDEVNGVEWISTQIGGERCSFGNLALVYAEFVNNDSFYAIGNFWHNSVDLISDFKFFAVQSKQ